LRQRLPQSRARAQSCGASKRAGALTHPAGLVEDVALSAALAVRARHGGLRRLLLLLLLLLSEVGEVRVCGGVRALGVERARVEREAAAVLLGHARLIAHAPRALRGAEALREPWRGVERQGTKAGGAGAALALAARRGVRIVVAR